MNCVSEQDPQLLRLADAIAQRVGQQRFHVWFNNSTRLDLKQDSLEISVPNDFISEWIGSHFAKPIQDAAHEVLGVSLQVRFNVVPQLFDMKSLAAGARMASAAMRDDHRHQQGGNGQLSAAVKAPIVVSLAPRGAAAGAGQAALGTGVGGMMVAQAMAGGTTSAPLPGAAPAPARHSGSAAYSSCLRLRHDLSTFVVGPSNQLAHNAALHVAEHPGSQYTPLFIHGNCGLGKSHLLQGICRQFMRHHPAKRWAYLTGEEFTNEFVAAMRDKKMETFRRRMRELDLLVIDDVHFLSGKKGTQEEFLHTFNAIEAMGRQLVMASDSHPKMIQEFGESLMNRFVSGMVVRVDPPNHVTRCEILRRLAERQGTSLSEEVINWVARRVTQNVRELEGALTRIAAHVKLSGRPADEAMAQEALGDLDRHLVAPVKTEKILTAVCEHFGLEQKEMLSSRRDRHISLARSIAMYLVRKLSKLSYPEIGHSLNKKNHSTVISACRRIEEALAQREILEWTGSTGPCREEAGELLQRLEEHCRCVR